jgi:Amt family ammonium transporter
MLLLAPALTLPLPAYAADGLNSGDTAWIIAASALVLLMTLPGLALFYAGLVRAQAVLSVVMHCFAIACVASVLWLVIGYSLAFDASIAGGWVGGFGKAFFAGVTPDAMNGGIPETVFAVFQMTFAVITPALIVGAYVERIKFSVVLWFSGAWLLLVYAPVCHWVWGGGWLAGMGIMDFAGGIVVHATAGVSALVIAIMLGARRGYPEHVRPPHNPGMTAMGAALLWVGWFGFNGGSQLAADGGAGMAIMATHIAASTAAIVWSAIEWIKFGKPSLVGAVTGVIAGLATVTPASGFVGPLGGLILGAAGGCLCFFAVQAVKFRFKIDDSLDVFAVHGVGGILGSLLVAVLALGAFGGGGLAEGQTAGGQLGVQAVGVLVTVVWSGVFTFIIIKVAGALTGGLRVSQEEEIEGLDLISHGETGYDLR